MIMQSGKVVIYSGMGEFLFKLFFEKHSGKGNTIAKMYTMIMCAFITQAFLKKYGYSFDHTVQIDFTSIMGFLLSKAALVVFVTFFISFIIIYNTYFFLVLPLFSVVLTIALFPVRLLYRMLVKEHFGGIYSRKYIEDSLKTFGIFSIHEHERYRKDIDRYDTFKTIVQDMNDEQTYLITARVFISVLLSTVVCLKLYGFADHSFFLHTLYTVLLWVLGALSFLAMVLIRYYLKAEFFEELLLSINTSEPPHVEKQS
jgi:hypothetical protein